MTLRKAQEILVSLRAVLDDIHKNRPVAIFYRKHAKEHEICFARADAAGRIETPEGYGWSAVHGKHHKRKFIVESIARASKLISWQKKLERQRDELRIQQPEMKRITPEEKRKHRASLHEELRARLMNSASQTSATVFAVDVNRRFVYVGGAAELPVQNDKSANLPLD